MTRFRICRQKLRIISANLCIGPSIFTSWRGFRSRGLPVDFGEEIEYWGDVVGKQLAPGELLECPLDARKAHLHPRVDCVEQAPLRVVLCDVLEQTQEVE